jgi:hypothetical protein
LNKEGDSAMNDETNRPAPAPDDEQDTEGHNTMVLQLGWDPIGERRRQAERSIRDDRPTVIEKRRLLGRFRRK